MSRMIWVMTSQNGADVCVVTVKGKERVEPSLKTGMRGLRVILGELC